MTHDDNYEPEFDDALSAGDVADPLSDDAARWASDVLDEARLDAPVPDEQASRRDAADLVLLDALLQHCHDPRPDEREARIIRVMSAIEAERSSIAPNHESLRHGEARLPRLRQSEPAMLPATRGRWRRLAGNLAAVAVTAAVVAGVAMFFSSPEGGARAAHAAVDQIYQAAALPTDRHYIVVSKFQNLENGIEREFYSDLYVRGAECFALRNPSLLGSVWIGSNGRKGWMLTPYNFVMWRDDPRLTIMWAREEGVTMPELQVTSQLDAARQYFDLDLLPSMRIDPMESPIAATNGPTLADPNILWQRIRCGIKHARPDQPYLLELWAHPETGVLRRMVFDWRPYSSWRGLTKVTVDLVSEEPRADEWYEPHGHAQQGPRKPRDK